MIKYFPERYSNNRTHLTKAYKIFKDADFENYAEPYHQLRDYIRQPVQEWKENLEIPKELLIQEPFVPENCGPDSDEFKEWLKWKTKTLGDYKALPRLEDETCLTKAIIDYEISGRNIFSYSKFLVELLSNTDVSEVRYRDIKLPYRTVYISFDPISRIEYPLESYELRNKIELEDRFFILDGAFVSQREPAAFEVLLTFIDTKADYNKKQNIITDHRFPVYKFTFDFSKWDSSMGLKIDIDSTFKESVVVFSDMWDESDQVGQLRYSEILKYTKKPETCDDAELEEYIIINESLKLIVNALCYINYKERDIRLSSTNELATPLLKRLDIERNNRERHKIFQKLEKLRFSKVYLFGQGIKNELVISSGGNELNPHWRRGHWRNQVYGDKLSLSKLIWIKPTIVRKDKGQPESGHIYEV